MHKNHVTAQHTMTMQTEATAAGCAAAINKYTQKSEYAITEKEAGEIMALEQKGDMQAIIDYMQPKVLENEKKWKEIGKALTSEPVVKACGGAKTGGAMSRVGASVVTAIVGSLAVLFF